MQEKKREIKYDWIAKNFLAGFAGHDENVLRVFPQHAHDDDEKGDYGTRRFFWVWEETQRRYSREVDGQRGDASGMFFQFIIVRKFLNDLQDFFEEVVSWL